MSSCKEKLKYKYILVIVLNNFILSPLKKMRYILTNTFITSIPLNNIIIAAILKYGPNGNS